MSVRTIENMVDWVEDNITKKPTLADMSKYVGYSPYYCSTKFKEHIGMTFKQYVAKRKLSLAAGEIRNTEDRILDIAIKYGFLSQEAFTRAFVQTFGYTPSRYRRGIMNIPLYARPIKRTRLQGTSNLD